MKQNQNSNVWLAVSIAGVIVAMVCGFYLGQSSNANVLKQSDLQSQYDELQKTLPLRLAADSASGGKTISMATGSITDEVDGLFILDHLTGGLQCWLLNPRTGNVGGIYVADVNAALGLDKGQPDFVMTTGAFFIRANGNLRAANTVCYVGDGKSGKVAGFSLAYDKAGIQQGTVQQGELNMVCAGPIRQAGAIRE
jgi:expansin (peptidoglycan-binding protein)